MKKFLALTLVALFTLTAFVGCGWFETPDEGLSYVTVDINPSFELVVKGDKVVSIAPLNADADAVIAEITITEDTTAEEVLADIVDEATEQGFLTEENADVTLTVVDEQGDADKSEKMYKKLEDAVKGHAQEIGKEFINACREANSAALALMELQEDPAYAENEDVQELNPGHYRLICEVMENCDLTLEEALELDVKELITKLHEARDTQKEQSFEERKEANKARKEAHKQALKEAKDKLIADLEEQLGMPIPELEDFDAVDDVVDQLEDYLEEIEETELTEAEITALAEIFSVTEEKLMQMVRDAKIELEDVFQLANKAISKHATPEERKAILDELRTLIDDVKARAMAELMENGEIAETIEALGLEIAGLEEAILAGDLEEILKLLEHATRDFDRTMNDYRESFTMPELSIPSESIASSALSSAASASLSSVSGSMSAPASDSMSTPASRPMQSEPEARD